MELNSRKLGFIIWLVGNRHFPRKLERNKACKGCRIHISRVKINVCIICFAGVIVIFLLV